MLRFHDGIDYDLRYKSYDLDLEFWKKMSDQYGGDILELGCGTGRITIPLALEGYNIEGIDIEESMLNEAKIKAKKENLNIKFHLADFRKFNFDKKFNLIILPFYSMSHNLTISDFERTMDCVKKHLQPNGKFIFDLYNPNLKILTRPYENFYIQAKYKDMNNIQIIMKERNKYDCNTQINHIQFVYEINNEIKSQDDYEMRVFFPKEIEALLKYNHFKIDLKFGNYNFENFSSESMRQIFICSEEKEYSFKWWGLN